MTFGNEAATVITGMIVPGLAVGAIPGSIRWRGRDADPHVPAFGRIRIGSMGQKVQMHVPWQPFSWSCARMARAPDSATVSKPASVTWTRSTRMQALFVAEVRFQQPPEAWTDLDLQPVADPLHSQASQATVASGDTRQ